RGPGSTRVIGGRRALGGGGGSPLPTGADRPAARRRSGPARGRRGARAGGGPPDRGPRRAGAPAGAGARALIGVRPNVPRLALWSRRAEGRCTGRSGSDAGGPVGGYPGGRPEAGARALPLGAHVLPPARPRAPARAGALLG